MDAVFIALEWIGVIAFAVSGAMVSVKKGMDLFGVVFLALVTAFGGGIMRDCLLGRVPPAFFTNYALIAGGVFAALSVFGVAYFMKEKYFANESAIEHVNNVFDALGLGAFAVTGSRIALEAVWGGKWFLTVSMGLLTAIGGGLLRDLMLREIPFVLNKRIYASAALLGGVCYFVLQAAGVGGTLSSCVGILVTFILRILATHYEWNLPRIIK